MAIVYKAYDTRLEREVAVKVIRMGRLAPDLADKTRKRFDREAKALARLNHVNIVQVIDFGEHDGVPYLVMPYLPGGTIKQIIKKGRITWGESVDMLAPIARALEYAHRQNIVHRDIKPSNVLIAENGAPMLSDFGVAKVLSDSGETHELTGTGMGVGTPEYMAPEQFRGQADERADIYALGVVLYEMVTGRKPYIADTPAEVIIKQAMDPLPRPSRFAPDLPASVENILIKSLAKAPKDRYQRMGEFSQALERLILAGEKDKRKLEEDKKKAELQLRKKQEKEKQKQENQKKKAELKAKKQEGNARKKQAAQKKKTELQQKKLEENARKIREEEEKKKEELQQKKALQLEKKRKETQENSRQLQEVRGQKARTQIEDKPAREKKAVSDKRRDTGSKKWVFAVVGLILISIVLVWSLDELPVTKPGSILSPVPAVSPDTSVLTPEASSPPSEENDIGSSWERPADGAIMIHIPAGEFIMGNNLDDSYLLTDDEKPAHEVYLDDFWIAETETTNSMYATCVDAGGCDDPIGGIHTKTLEHPTHPVSASWEMAAAYCRWADARLPTEAEWEKAARGGLEGKLYPWGDDPPTCETGANSNTAASNCAGVGALDVKSLSPNGYGLFDMAGNMQEWVSDWYGADYYSNSPSKNPTGPASGTYRVLRGGSWELHYNYGLSATRFWSVPDESIIYPSYGFRCVRDAPRVETPQTTFTSVPSPIPTETPMLPKISGEISFEMELIPAGEFEMGSEDGDRMPVHTVYLDAFWMNQTEITNSMYFKCVDTGECEDPGDSKRTNAVEHSNRPVSGNWFTATTYCDWADARLPTEAEWEKASRGGLVRKSYPWGNDFSSCQPGASNGAQTDSCSGYIIDAKTFAPNGYGLYDMAGNMGEWVADWYSSDYYSSSPYQNPTGPPSGIYRVVRGGSFSDMIQMARSNSAFRAIGVPSNSTNGIGFRCARDANLQE